MNYKIMITKSSAIIALAALLTPTVSTLAENISLETEKTPSHITATNNEGGSSDLADENTVSPNSENEVVGTPISPGHHWGALEANGHNLYRPNNHGTNNPGQFYYTQPAQNWFTGLFNGNYHDISGNGPYTFIINSNYPIDTESFVLSAGKIGEMYDASNAYTIQWENNNKTAKVTFDELKAVNQMGSAFAATYYVLSNNWRDLVRLESYVVDASGELLGDKTNAQGYYMASSSGHFRPTITTEDKTVYTSDPKLDLLSLASAYDFIDGDISQDIFVRSDDDFDQSKPGVYEVWYNVTNSHGEIGASYAFVTVKEDKSSIEAHDSTINVGDEWKPEDNFDSATDKDGNPVDFSKVTVTGTVDTANPGKYEITYEFEGVSKTVTVTLRDSKASIEAHDSTLNVGDEWKPEDNFDKAVDKEGNSVDFADVTVNGTVDTNKPGKYEITYEFGDVSKTIVVTVLDNTLKPTPNIGSNNTSQNVLEHNKNINQASENKNVKKAPTNILPSTGETSEKLISVFGFLSLILGTLWFFITKKMKKD